MTNTEEYVFYVFLSVYQLLFCLCNFVFKLAAISKSDVSTAISAVGVTRAQAQDGVAYNLAGQRVGKDYKGVVIINFCRKIESRRP